MKTDSLNHQLHEARFRLTREIRENPLVCVGIALGIGAVIGALGSRAATSHPRRARWISDLATSLSDEASKLSDTAARAGHRATKDFQSVLEKTADAAPDIDLERLVRRGRHWLRSVLR